MAFRKTPTFLKFHKCGLFQISWQPPGEYPPKLGHTLISCLSTCASKKYRHRSPRNKKRIFANTILRLIPPIPCRFSLFTGCNTLFTHRRMLSHHNIHTLYKTPKPWNCTKSCIRCICQCSCRKHRFVAVVIVLPHRCTLGNVQLTHLEPRLQRPDHQWNIRFEILTFGKHLLVTRSVGQLSIHTDWHWVNRPSAC